MSFLSDLFSKKKDRMLNQTWIHGECYYVEEAVYKRILELEKEVSDELFNRAIAEDELRKIKPIVERRGFKHVVSSECNSCKYAVNIAQRPYGVHTLVGCRKDMVCEDYTPVEE